MSKYEWEDGVLVLPGAQVGKVRKSVVSATRETHEWAKMAAGQFWAANSTRSQHVYVDRLDRWMKMKGHQGYWGSSLREELHAMLYSVAGKPRKIQGKDLDRWFPVAKRGEDLIRIGDEAFITFRGRELRWVVPENNHAVDRAHAHPVAQALFKALAAVKWTRGSGGELVGNDEYNRDSSEAGGGANYVRQTFGP